MFITKRKLYAMLEEARSSGKNEAFKQCEDDRKYYDLNDKINRIGARLEELEYQINNGNQKISR